MKNSQFARVLAYTAVGVLTAVVLWGLLGNSFQKGRAAPGPNGVTFTFTPATGTFNPGESQTTTLLVTPNTQGKQISAFDIRLKATGNTEFISVSKPLNFTADNELVNTVLPGSIRLAYTVGINNPLADSVQFSITFKGKAPGPGAIEVDTTNSEIVGNVDNYSFALDNVTNPSFTYGTVNGAGASVTFPGTGTPLPVGTDTPVTVHVDTSATSQKISAIDFTFESAGEMNLVKSNGPATGFDEMTPPTSVTAKSARIVHTARTDANPQVTSYDVTFMVHGNNPGTGTLTLKSAVIADLTGKAIPVSGTPSGTYTFGNAGGGNPTNTPVPQATNTPPGSSQCTGEEKDPVYYSLPGYTASYSKGKVTFTGGEGKIVMYKASVPYWGPDWVATQDPQVIEGNTADVPAGNYQADFIKKDAVVLKSPASNGDNYAGRGVLLAAVNGSHRDCTGTGGNGGGGEPPPPPEIKCVANDAISQFPECDINSATYNKAACRQKLVAFKGVEGPADDGDHAWWDWAYLPPNGVSCGTACGAGPSRCLPGGVNPGGNNGGGGGNGGNGGGNGGGNQGTGNMSLTLKLKLQGITKRPAVADPDVFQVTLMGPSETVMSGSFIPDANGLYVGTVTGNATPGTYYLLVKGPRHIQKKICDSAPFESRMGTYNCSVGKIQLNAGTNALDFSQVALMVGDLPMQDGVVDSYDFSYIRQTLGSTKKSELVVGDLNRDGIIDSQDMSLMLQALSIKYDEE